jgi:RNA polymerase sigma-70 factor (ECF subfamily)
VQSRGGVARYKKCSILGIEGGALRRHRYPTYAADVMEEELVGRLQQKDEAAFATLVDRYHLPMVRLAQTFVPNRSVAEEVVQDTWLAVIGGIDGFEGRSSVKTWLFRILVNRARTTGARERRTIAVDDMDSAPVEHFAPDGSWGNPPTPWADDVVDRLFATSVAKQLMAAIDDLPPVQCQVVTLRDVERLSAGEVCDVLGITEANQRVLLHRARGQLRRTIETEIGGR